MNKQFPDTLYVAWSEEDKRRLAWLHRCGVPIEMAIADSKNWHLDHNHDPQRFQNLKYRPQSQ